MKAVTIDNFDIKEHIRWAKDREVLDPSLVNGPPSIATQSEITGVSAIFPSRLEELFEWEKGVTPWATFMFPGTGYLLNRRLFTFRLFPYIEWGIEWGKESEDVETQDSQNAEPCRKNLIEKVIAAKNPFHSTVFEKDKSAILNMLFAIKGIDDMLEQITSRKVRYQKG